MKHGLLILSTILLSLTSCGQSMGSASNSLSERIDEESSYSFYTKDKYLAFLVEATGIEVGKDDRIEILYFKQCENGKFYKFYFNKNDVDTIEVVADVYVGKEKLLELNNPSYRAVFIKNDGTCVYPTRTEDSFECSFEEGLFLEEEIRDIQNSFGIVSPFTLSAEERLIKAANIELEDSREVVLYCNVECQKGWFYIYRIEPVTGGLSVIVEVYLNENSILTFPDSTYRVAYVGYDMEALYMGKGSKYVLPPDYITDEEAALIKEEYHKKWTERQNEKYKEEDDPLGNEETANEDNVPGNEKEIDFEYVASLTHEERIAEAKCMTPEEKEKINLYCYTECRDGWFYVWLPGPDSGGISEIEYVVCNGKVVVVYSHGGFKSCFITRDMKLIEPVKLSSHSYGSTTYEYPAGLINEEEAETIQEQYRNKSYEEATKMY